MTEIPCLEEYKSWLRSRSGQYFLEKMREWRETELNEVECGGLRGDRESGASSEFLAGEVTGSLAILGRILRGEIEEELRPSEEEKSR